eukprot:3521426-Prymnesium_polylepis.1
MREGAAAAPSRAEFREKSGGSGFSPLVEAGPHARKVDDVVVVVRRDRRVGGVGGRGDARAVEMDHLEADGEELPY